MQIIFSEKASKDEWEDGIYYLKEDVYAIYDCIIDAQKYDFPIVSGRKLHFTCDIPEDSDIFITYAVKEGVCGECLTLQDIRRRAMYEMWGSEDLDMDGFSDAGLDRYIGEAITAINEVSPNVSSKKQYCFRIGQMTDMKQGECGCDNRYSVDDYTPDIGLAKLDSGQFIKYQKVKGKIKVDKQFNTTGHIVSIGYKMPKPGKILSIKADNRDIEFQEYGGYYFFPTTNAVICVEYLPTIHTISDCCIEFDNNFGNLIVYWVAYRAFMVRSDPRAGNMLALYSDTLRTYKKYVNGLSGNLAHSGWSIMPGISSGGLPNTSGR